MQQRARTRQSYQFKTQKSQIKLAFFFCGLVLVLLLHSFNPDQTQTLHKRNLLQGDDDETDNQTECLAANINAAPDPCEFVIQYCEDERNESRVPYINFPFCALPQQKWLAYIILIAAVLLCFYILGTVADRFFLPALSSVSSSLNLPPTVAGVTLLGWGNGAPDISATFANVQAGKYSQSFGQLIGAGMFVGICISGIVVLIQTTTVKRRPFLRDVGFFIVTICSVFFVCYDHTISVWEGAIWLGLYATYVLFVVVGRFVYSKRKERRHHNLLKIERTRLIELGQNLPADHPIFNVDLTEFNSNEINEDFIISVVKAIEANDLPEIEGETEEAKEEKRKILEAVLDEMDVTYLSKVGFYNPETKRKERPIPEMNIQFDGGDDSGDVELQDGAQMAASTALDNDVVDLDDIYDQATLPTSSKWTDFLEFFEWNTDSKWEKVWNTLTAPIILCLHAIIPWTEEDKYNRYLYTIHPTAVVLFILFIYEGYWKTPVHIRDTPLGLLIYWIGPAAIILSIIVWFTTKPNKPPIYSPVFVFASLVLSALVISFFANELVAMLGALGVSWSINPAVMGLTVLSWGNSIGDMMSNTMIARKGFPQMAIGACLSAPLTNLLIGLGLAFLVATLEEPSHQIVLDSHRTPIPDLSNAHYVGLFFLLGTLVLVLVVVPICSFTFHRVFGGIMVAIYLVFLTTSLLMAFGVILPDVILWDF